MEEIKELIIEEPKSSKQAEILILNEDWVDYDSWIDEQFKSLTEGEFSRFTYEQNI